MPHLARNSRQGPFATCKRSVAGLKRLQLLPCRSHPKTRGVKMNGSHQNGLHHDIDRVLFTEEQIASRIEELGRQIATDCQNDRPLLIAALNGACIFLSDLSRSIQPVPDGINIDFIRASSYNTASTSASTGNIKLGSISEGKFNIRDRHVIIVEDIVDSGHTAKKLKEYFLSLGAKSVRLATLLDKSERRSVDIKIDYCGFWCEDAFVVGYGLDYNEDYRTLPYVGVLKQELYTA